MSLCGAMPSWTPPPNSGTAVVKLALPPLLLFSWGLLTAPVQSSPIGLSSNPGEPPIPAACQMPCPTHCVRASEQPRLNSGCIWDAPISPAKDFHQLQLQCLL